ncbi:hypothetical protein BKA61DRAFT_643367 [Leptodontidium sp. MPI-SDFR-AT-0119]|nr:hypothetical protein BKA61DRAFT_643367 [Leptodontidium sp. MPI-SDFR-AT-0119]
MYSRSLIRTEFFSRCSPTTEPGILTSSSAKAPWTVERVVAKLPGGTPVAGSSSPVPFFHMLERLETAKREGWRRYAIPHGESISDHMYRMSLITMFAPQSILENQYPTLHEDGPHITPMDGVTKHEKNRREEATMDYFTSSLLGKVNGGITGKDIYDIWREYEDGETLESEFIQDVDKIELVLQMVDYERVHEHKLDLGDFSWVSSRIVLPEVKEWASEVLREREGFWGGRQHAAYSAGEPLEEKSLAQKVEYYGDGDA